MELSDRGHGGDRPIPPSVEEKIELARRQLQRASAVLACLAVASDEDAAVDFSDVACVARKLIDSAIEDLDLVELMRGLWHRGDSVRRVTASQLADGLKWAVFQKSCWMRRQRAVARSCTKGPATSTALEKL